ncbi:glutamate--tRNA ligase [Phreatobacter sp. AB_2022a]|uniref:glutamate--tRNA ligase n=1 Tax=Phreatobacter sp. AB_2022a TaxID=3003134 RepID=UPI00228768D4|nr:glutamate--tRNA ligase [Phreatobacter sp. AB_2022a]MCZ0733556.1 glutamate--tRNA ligase [Phreatobacter sp. AB_2022a]
MTVVTRFAPSPTGFLHIGGARTALFNWLYAKKTGGQMLLRIEDTDRQRSTDEAIAAILDGLSWLGLEWDGQTTYQFARAERHAAVAREMLAAGKAYYCYATPQELEEMRELAMKEGRPPRYDGRWRDRDPSEAPAGVKPVIRLRARQDGETVVNDLVQGRVVIPNKDLDDLVLLRSDGTPTYMHAVVVDDHDMGVTHVIRGVDHLTNAARQTQIYEALGWPVPAMAHIPLIHGPDGAKLSKRHGALGVDAYRAMGYLPEALRNYLVRLGWSHGDQEIFSTEEMIEAFDLDAIGRSAARFDFAKLEATNGHYIRNADDTRLMRAIDEVLPHIPEGAAIAASLTPEARAQVLRAMPGLKERAKTVLELIDGAAFITAKRPLAVDAKAAALLTDEARGHLAALHQRLAALGEWSAAAADAAVRAEADARNVKLGALAQPLRAALTGRTTSPGIFDVLEALGRTESLARIADQMRTPA